MADFDKELKRFFIGDLKKQTYNEYGTGVEDALKTVEGIEGIVEQFKQKMEDFEYYAKMFEMNENTSSSRKTLGKIERGIAAMRGLWEHIQIMQETFDRFLKMEWKDLNCSDMEDEAKDLQRALTKMKDIERKIDTYSEAKRLVNNWLTFMPLVSDLKNDYMDVEDQRHWNNFRSQMETELVVDENTLLEELWVLDLYTRVRTETIEEITERAK